MDSSSFFRKGSKFNGKIYTKRSISIETKINANIIALSSIFIKENAVITGDLIASAVNCSGSIKGNIQCSDLIEISSTGKVIGNINSTNLIIEKGGSIKGECQVKQVDLNFEDFFTDHK